MTRPFEGVRIIDVTHVLAGPFAAYQLAVLGADVIKVEDPNDPDQTRGTGSDRTLNRTLMGTGFLTQASNKRAIALNLKTEEGCQILKRRHRGGQSHQIRLTRGRLRDRNDGRICPRQRFVSARAYRPGSAHRSRDA